MLCVLYFSVISDSDNVIEQKGSEERTYGKESNQLKRLVKETILTHDTLLYLLQLFSGMAGFKSWLGLMSFAWTKRQNQSPLLIWLFLFLNNSPL